MHKLDPIERLPDGSLFRLTPGQLRSVRGLTKRCCNFLDGDCLLLDGVCPQFISRSLICRWFRRAVLPRECVLKIFRNAFWWSSRMFRTAVAFAIGYSSVSSSAESSDSSSSGSSCGASCLVSC